MSIVCGGVFGSKIKYNGLLVCAEQTLLTIKNKNKNKYFIVEKQKNIQK
jgi:hypothetical protein